MACEHPRRTCINAGHLPLALVYPNTYRVGMSSLGFQTVFRLFGNAGPFRCERAFLYEDRFSHFTSTLETEKSLRTFPLIGFSLSYELDYPSLLTILNRAGVPALARYRDAGDPLILVGGVSAFYNPAVLASVADAIFIGELEAFMEELTALCAGSEFETMPRQEILQHLARIEGVYVPSVHGLSPPFQSIKRRHMQIGNSEPSTSLWVTEKAHLNMFLTEIGRGCGRGCRFCAAGHVYHPFRVWSMDAIMGAVEKYSRPGDRIGLVGAALSDFKDLDALCEHLVRGGRKIGLSSLRADCINATLMESLQSSGIHSITMAPEAGSERLRTILNKRITDEQILSAVELIAAYDVRQLKLYYMIGLPFEESGDIQAIGDLTGQIARRFFSRRLSREIRVSINAFIPKPFTPFQWAPLAGDRDIKSKRKMLHSLLNRLPGVSMTQKSGKSELLQAVLSLGNFSTGERLAAGTAASLHELAADEQVMDWLHKEKDREALFPWDFLECGVNKARLWQSWRKAKSLAKG